MALAETPTPMLGSPIERAYLDLRKGDAALFAKLAELATAAPF